MPKLKVLSGAEIVKILEQFDFAQVGQKGSHIKMQRITSMGHKESLTIPNHKELSRGTVKDILNQTVRYVPREELERYFYHP